MRKVFDFLQEVRIELQRVSWLSKNQVIRYTEIIIAISIVIGVFIGLTDFLLTKGLALILK